MSEKLNVRVAEALGWTWKRSPTGNCRFLCPPTRLNLWGIKASDYLAAGPDLLLCDDAHRYVPRYDTDWSATGPLIEKHGIELGMLWPGDWGGDGFRWYAITAGDSRGGLPLIEGATPLLAVCNLILALKAAGKLVSEEASKPSGQEQER